MTKENALPFGRIERMKRILLRSMKRQQELEDEIDYLQYVQEQIILSDLEDYEAMEARIDKHDKALSRQR